MKEEGGLLRRLKSASGHQTPCTVKSLLSVGCAAKKRHARATLFLFSCNISNIIEPADTVDIVIFDGRNIPEKSKVEFTPEEMVEYIVNDIQYAYDGVTFNVLPKAKYYKPSEEGHVTIKIGIAAYQAGFGADVNVAIGSVGGSFSYGISPKGRWNGITSFYVRVYDKRNGTNIEKEDSVVSQVDKPNITGYITARKCLKESYADAFGKLCFFVDSVFMQ